MLSRNLKASRKELGIERSLVSVGCVAYPVGARGEGNPPPSHPFSM